MRKFDYSFLDKGMIPANLVNTIAGIYTRKAAADARKEPHAEVFAALETAAKVQSVKGSCAIEGVTASDRRVAELVTQNAAPLNRGEAELAGYKDALAAVRADYGSMDFRRGDILFLHRTMFSAAGYEYGGRYKTADNVIVEQGPDGVRRVRFRPVPAKDTEAAMEQLELAYFAARDNADINQLLLIPCVILDFLCVHPFQDGNGRLSRLLGLLLLYKNGFDAGKYISFEERLCRYQAYYYEALRRSSAGWAAAENDYFPFMTNFLVTLYMCYTELDRRFAVLPGNRITKKARVEAAVLDSLLPISKAELCALHPDISPTTVEAVLGAMVKDGRIRRIGAGKSSRYRRNDGPLGFEGSKLRNSSQ